MYLFSTHKIIWIIHQEKTVNRTFLMESSECALRLCNLLILIQNTVNSCITTLNEDNFSPCLSVKK